MVYMDKVRKHRKTKILLTTLLICALVIGGLTGCGSGDGADPGSDPEISASQSAGDQTADKTEKKGSKTKDKEKAAEEKTGEKEAGETAKSDDGKKETRKSSSSSSKKSSKKSGSSSSSKKSQSSSSSSQKTSKCTISITCHKLVGNKNIDSSTKSRVPSSGVIMSSVKVEIKSGDSVYDVLKRACQQKGIVVSAQNTSLGIYVAGINGIYEKAAGSESGWKYKLNGSYPGDSAGDVKVKDGDVIEWVYALEA